MVSELGLLLTYPIVRFLVPKKTRFANHPANGKVIVIIERWLHPNPLHRIGKRYLESKGFTVYLVSHLITKDSFLTSAVQLKKFIESKNLSNVTLVGISSGGISALLYLEELHGWDRVKIFISIATPFGGTLIALPLALIQSCREILPWSATTKKIQSLRQKEPAKVICIVARYDELVPRKSAILPGSSVKIINVIGHNSLHLTCTQTYEAVAKLAD